MFEHGGHVKADNKRQLTLLLGELNHRLQHVTTEYGEAMYRQYVERKAAPELAGLDQERSRLVLYPGLLDTVQQFQSTVSDSFALELKLWERILTLAQVTNDPDIKQLERKVAADLIEHEYQIEGQRTDLATLREIIRRNPDSDKRKQAYLAMAEPHPKLVAGVRQLIEMRNDKARKLGYTSYTDMALTLSGTSRTEVESILNDLHHQLDDLYTKIMSDNSSRLGFSAVKPWDVQYVAEAGNTSKPELFPRDQVVPTVQRWAIEHDLDCELLGIAFTLTDIPYGGLCMPIARKDTRILANPVDGFSSYQTMFHEFGHAVHASLINRYHVTHRSDSGLFHEAMAETFGFIIKDQKWFDWYGITSKQASALLKGSVGPFINRLRRLTASTLFEYQIYDNPSVNADKLYADLEAELLGCEPDYAQRWSANAWYASYPIYWQNYVLASSIAAQIHASMYERHGAVHGNKQALSFIIDTFIRPGASIPWRKKLLSATGSDLNAKPLADMIRSLY